MKLSEHIFFDFSLIYTGLKFETKLKINHYCLKSFCVKPRQKYLKRCQVVISRQNKTKWYFFPYFDVLSAAIPQWLWCNENKRRRRMTIAIDKREIISVFNVLKIYQYFRWSEKFKYQFSWLILPITNLYIRQSIKPNNELFILFMYFFICGNEEIKFR